MDKAKLEAGLEFAPGSILEVNQKEGESLQKACDRTIAERKAALFIDAELSPRMKAKLTKIAKERNWRSQ